MGAASSENNSFDQLGVTPMKAVLGAEVTGVDFAKPVCDAAKQVLRQAWADHLVLLFRGQAHISVEDHVAATTIFGDPAKNANTAFVEKAGAAPDYLAQHPKILVVSNLGPDGKPVIENQGLGSGEVVWHSDNSYVETPPAGSMLRALEIPPDGAGDTSFSNQYLAYEMLPDDIKQEIRGLYTRHDASRNSAGRLRPGVNKPAMLEDVPGPNHPLVRLHPVTGKKALYLGRRRDFPSQYVIGWSREKSEKLLDFLWDHATHDDLAWTHHWSVGDIVLWDNRCTMHYREAHAGVHRRILHRTQFGKEKPIAA